jgi:hypothetical protein
MIKMTKHNTVRKLEEKVVIYVRVPPSIHLHRMGKSNANFNQHSVRLTVVKQKRKIISMEKHKNVTNVSKKTLRVC